MFGLVIFEVMHVREDFSFRLLNRYFIVLWKISAINIQLFFLISRSKGAVTILEHRHLKSF